MSINFYIHTPVNNMNERRALCRMARLLHQQYASPDTPEVAVIANIDPPPEARMTQLDCVIVSQDCVALVDFKNYPAPFDGPSEHRPWFIRGTNLVVQGGSARGYTSNPFQQAKRAHTRWIDFFISHTQLIVHPGRARHIDWRHLNGFVLFYPFLHEESVLPQPSNWQKWLAFASIDRVVDLLFSSKSSIELSRNEVKQFAETAFEAHPWHDIERLLRDHVGYLRVQQPNTGEVAFPLFQYDELTVGRSRQNRIRIAPSFKRVSRTHLILATDDRSTAIMDIADGNKTFINGQHLTPHIMTPIQDGDEIVCGEYHSAESCRLHFTVESPILNHPLPTPFTEKTRKGDL